MRNNLTPRVVYAGNDTVDEFAVSVDGEPIWFRDNDDVIVQERSNLGVVSTLVEGTDYTLAGGPDEGEVTRLAGDLPSGAMLAVYRKSPISQETDFTLSGDWNASRSILNDALDRITEIMQEINDRAERALRSDAFNLGYDADNKVISNVANGITAQDAATVGQLQALAVSAIDAFRLPGLPAIGDIDHAADLLMVWDTSADAAKKAAVGNVFQTTSAVGSINLLRNPLFYDWPNGTPQSILHGGGVFFSNWWIGKIGFDIGSTCTYSRISEFDGGLLMDFTSAGLEYFYVRQYIPGIAQYSGRSFTAIVDVETDAVGMRCDWYSNIRFNASDAERVSINVTPDASQRELPIGRNILAVPLVVPDLSAYSYTKTAENGVEFAFRVITLAAMSAQVKIHGMAVIEGVYQGDVPITQVTNDGDVLAYWRDSTWVNDATGLTAYVEGQPKLNIGKNGDTIISSSADDFTSDRILSLKMLRATPTANDRLFIAAYAKNNANEEIEITRESSRITNITDGAESSQMFWSVLNAGTLIEYILLAPTTFAPVANDRIPLGLPSLAWSDLYLASGGFIDFGNGFTRVSHDNYALTVTQGLDTANVKLANFIANRATPANNDTACLSIYMNNNATPAKESIEMARIVAKAMSVTDGSETSRLILGCYDSGTYADRLFLSGTMLAPITNDGLALGSATQQWSDVFLASGAVLNFANGDVTITHSTGVLDFGTATVRMDALRLDQTPTTISASSVTLGSAGTLKHRISLNLNGTTYWIPAGTTAF